MIRDAHYFEGEYNATWNHVGQQVDIQVDVGLGELRHIATDAQTFCAVLRWHLCRIWCQSKN